MNLVISNTELDFLNSSISIVNYLYFDDNRTFFKEGLKLSSAIKSYRQEMEGKYKEIRRSYSDKLIEGKNEEGMAYEYKIISDEKQPEFEKATKEFLESDITITIHEANMEVPFRRYLTQLLSLTPAEQKVSFNNAPQRGAIDDNYITNLYSILEKIEAQLPDLYKECAEQAEPVVVASLEKEKLAVEAAMKRREEKIMGEHKEGALL